MEKETRDEVTAWTRMGFYSKEELREIFCEELYEPGELDEDEVLKVILTERTRLITEQMDWPDETDCDRIDKVFECLNKQGVIALQNAGYTQSEGYEDICEIFHQSPNKSPIRGYCFYHTQDLERASRGEGLFLSFGPMDPKKEESDGVFVGSSIVAEFEREGFTAKWDGTFNQRIFIENIDWKKRIA